jgi:hypothetical protein
MTDLVCSKLGGPDHAHEAAMTRHRAHLALNVKAVPFGTHTWSCGIHTGFLGLTGTPRCCSAGRAWHNTDT